MNRILNLDYRYSPVSSGVLIPYIMEKFSGGEWDIKVSNTHHFANTDQFFITHRCNNSDAIMQILIANDALINAGAKNITLVIPYLPYARQDRICNIGESFTLKVFANLINSCNFKQVVVIDAHSLVGPALIDRCINAPTNYIQQVLINLYKEIEIDDLYFVAPDAGSATKVDKLGTKFNTKVVNCTKVRDPETMSITTTKVHVEGDELKGKACLIVDDICDGGRTFIAVAKALKEKGAAKVYLCVTHGIFSYGTDVLKEYIDHVYTTDSIRDNGDDIVTVINTQIC